MPVYWLADDSLDFPDPEGANEDGLVALGGDLSPDRLLTAYNHGLFPWFNAGDPILWWSPDPRFVLFPGELKVSKSMRPYFNQRKFEVSYDADFRAVITACQQMFRPGQEGTWITDDMVEAYCQLHRLGFAHSVEVWKEQELVGGLYGIALGRVFFGESMFAKASNASKFGFISLVRRLEEHGYNLIDCQQKTQHLVSLGGRGIPRTRFLTYLTKNDVEKTERGNWN
jgi:leucyl/phenylalanyl-tRNA---protein transferase